MIRILRGATAALAVILAGAAVAVDLKQLMAASKKG